MNLWPLPAAWWPLAAARRLPALMPAWLRRRFSRRHAPAAWRAGLSVVIPDRNSPALLADCLEALMPALAVINEPWQVIISTSDTPSSTYAEIAQRHPQLEWRHSEPGLGYSRAIAQAMPTIRYDHTYLLNNDMRLHSDALAHILECRDDDVFAVASQIFMADHAVRREETGLTACSGFPHKTTLFDVEPGDDPQIRKHLYAGGGSSLFRSAPLRDYVRQSVVYEPAYWEDVEWGLRAWREGWRVLFCPHSHAVHRHRTTVSRLFPAHEIERLFQRNGRWFDLRNDDGCDLAERLRDLSNNVHSMAETQHWSFALATLMAQLRNHGRSPPTDWFIARHDIRMTYSRALDERPRLLFVSDERLLPTCNPRTSHLLQQLATLARSFNVSVVARKAGQYVSEAIREASFLTCLWLVDGDIVDNADESASSRLRPDLQEAVLNARHSFQPDVVLLDDPFIDTSAFDRDDGCWQESGGPLIALDFPGSRRLHAFQQAFLTKERSLASTPP